MPRKNQKTGKYIECEWCGKLVYKTQTELKKGKHHYCSNECHAKARHVAAYENRPCELCGKLMYVAKKSKQRFCSPECQKIWQTQQVGELNIRFTQEKIRCEYCGEEFYIKQYKINNGQHHFCSKKCRQHWYADVWSQSEKWKEESKRRAVEVLKNNQTTTLTKPQIIINNLLKDMKIKFRNEEPFVYYSADNYLIDYDLIIEVMGDYWHSNPLKHDVLNDMQKKNIRRDKAKHTFLLEHYGINVLYLWEKDILENPELCKELIKLYIKEDGVLQNYHSFNYFIENDRLTLQKEPTKPYQDMKAEEIKKYIKIAI